MCVACDIEDEISTDDDPNPVPERFHTCMRFRSKGERVSLIVIYSLFVASCVAAGGGVWWALGAGAVAVAYAWLDTKYT